MRRVILAVPVLLVLAAIGVGSTVLGLLSLRAFSPLPPTDERQSKIVIRTLLSLREQLHNGRALERMQARFPEGACFTLTLYALAWGNVAGHPATLDSVRSTALTETGWALEQYNRPVVMSPFTATQVRNGTLWLGQRNLVLAQYLKALPPSERPGTLVEEFHSNSGAIAEALSASPTAHLDTYPGLCWPGDNVPALVSLVLHDEMFSTDYRAACERWCDWTLAHSDPRTSLPVGQLDSATGTVWQPARGSASSWILALLPGVDPALSRWLYQLYVQHFQVNRLGFRTFREYANGVTLRGDVDSGPIIFGVGTVATGAGLAAALANGDLRTAQDLHGLANAIGLRRGTREGGTEYLLGGLPVADAFLALGYSLADPHATAVEAFAPSPATYPGRWLLTATLILMTLAVLVIARRLLRWAARGKDGHARCMRPPDHLDRRARPPVPPPTSPRPGQ